MRHDWLLCEAHAWSYRWSCKLCYASKHTYRSKDKGWWHWAIVFFAADGTTLDHEPACVELPEVPDLVARASDDDSWRVDEGGALLKGVSK